MIAELRVGSRANVARACRSARLALRSRRPGAASYAYSRSSRKACGVDALHARDHCETSVERLADGSVSLQSLLARYEARECVRKAGDAQDESVELWPMCLRCDLVRAAVRSIVFRSHLPADKAAIHTSACAARPLKQNMN
jgi:hypothetical protein